MIITTIITTITTITIIVIVITTTTVWTFDDIYMLTALTRPLPDTYEKGVQDTVEEENMDVSADEEGAEALEAGGEEKPADDDQKPLLPPEVFEHIKSAADEEQKGAPNEISSEYKGATILRAF